MVAVYNGYENLARWMIAHGADVGATSHFTSPVFGWSPEPEEDEQKYSTVFNYACRRCSVTFVQELADKVPPAHLDAGPVAQCYSPMATAFILNTAHRIPMVKMLVLRGAAVHVAAFPASEHNTTMSLVKQHLELLEWAEGELENHRTFIALLLGCGVLGSGSGDVGGDGDGNGDGNGDGGGGGDGAPAMRPNLLSKLRGDGNTDARMRIARCLGVRTGVELGRLRRAAAVWRGIYRARVGVLFREGTAEVLRP